MPISFRTAVESDWESICRADGRAFGFAYPPELIDEARSIHDVSRFELALDGKEIVGIVAAFSSPGDGAGRWPTADGRLDLGVDSVDTSASGPADSADGQVARRHRSSW